MEKSLHVAERRRRTRICLCAPIMVRSLDPDVKCHATGDTIDVSSSGALLRLPLLVLPGTRLRLDLLNSDRVTEARVIRCDRNGKTWRVRVQLLQQTGNFWDVKIPPTDWDPASRPHEESEYQWVG
jgi:hypothetical protein